MPKIRRGKRKGEYISWKEAFELFKEGISRITPLQLAENSARGQWITLLGIALGLAYSLSDIKKLYFLAIILTGAIYVAVTQQIGTYQRIWTMRKVEALYAKP